jgi:carbon-monoxide dehydrogenase small subunit
VSPKENKVPLKMIVNGKPIEVSVDPTWTLLMVLREELKLTGTKKGCEKGDCGVCTVLLEGKPVNSCLVLALQAEGKKIETIENLGTPESLHPLQKSFITHGAVQCGFCTPGMLMSASSLLRKNPHPTEEEIRRAISGNLCRCTGYAKIVKAIQEAGTAKE